MEESSAIPLRLALLAAASFASHALLHGDANPSQGDNQKKITDRDEKRQHRPLPSMQHRVFALNCVPLQGADGDINAKLRSHCYAATPLDAGASNAKYRAMLQHNSAQAGKRAHIAHAALIGFHALCCGLPALAMAAAAVSGLTSGAALMSGVFEPLHALLHTHEVWILVGSAVLVVSGGVLEVLARRGAHAHGFPWLFAFSVGCFLANVAIVLAHRAG